MRVLITNITMSGRHGTTLYVRDLALRLLRRGHTPVVYSPEIGDVGWELQRATVPVTDDLSKIDAAPDVIHGNQNQELLTALLRFPGVPAVRVCHGWLDEPPWPFPRVLRYIPVDDTTLDRCLFEWGLPEERVRVLLNWVDLELFAPRAPLPPRPLRALVFSNQALRFLEPVRRACAASGVRLDAAGAGVGVAEEPGRLLARYDLVFAKARAALEAMAVGNAVILCDAVGVGPLVRSDELDRLRRLNFGIRTLSQPHDPGTLAREIARYDADDAARVTRRIRESADCDHAVDELVALYEEVLAEFRGGGPSDLTAELRATSGYLRTFPSRLKDWPDSIGMGVWIIARSLFRRAAKARWVRRTPGLRSLSRHSPVIRWLYARSRRLRP